MFNDNNFMLSLCKYQIYCFNFEILQYLLYYLQNNIKHFKMVERDLNGKNLVWNVLLFLLNDNEDK